MRLFISINFDNAAKEKLLDTQEALRKYTLKGKFTHNENLHLTLVFIGETSGDNIIKIKKAIETAVSIPAFSFQLSGAGSFKRSGGDIWWVGTKPCKELLELQSKITQNLSHIGVKFDSKPFSPHLTIAREVVLDKGFDNSQFSQKVPIIHVAVRKISLMKSERISGKLTYTEIYTVYLTGEHSKGQ